MDFYDDPEGSLLKSKLSDDQLQQFLKEGQVLSQEDTKRLPDRLFALVMDGDDGRMRKYACNDGTNTALSIIYFMENWKDLPVSAVKTAAANLVEFCDCYDVNPPALLEKLAIAPLTALSLAVGGMYGSDVAKAGMTKRDIHLLKAGIPPRAKMADLTGSHAAPLSEETIKKKASINPYVEFDPDEPLAKDVIDWQQAAVEEPKLKLASITDFYTAVDYFKENHVNWEPKEKVAFCRPLLERAKGLGLQNGLPLEIWQYGNEKKAEAEYISSMLELRRNCFTDDEIYCQYLQKVAEVSDLEDGDFLAEKLAEIDKEFYIDRYWSTEFPDPWRVVFGLVKTGGYAFEDGEEKITESELQKLAVDGREKMLGHFNEDVVNEFQKNAVAIFDSLPLDHKRIIMRLAD
jgi:hypothetical protein